MRNVFKRVGSAFTVGVLLFSCVFIGAKADTLSDLQAQKSQAEAERNALQSEANGLNANYKDVKSQYNALKSQVDSTNNKVNATNTEIGNLSKELSTAKTNQAELEEMMKVHIKYMYENNQKSMLEIFLESKSVAEFVERAEYFSIIAEHDKKLLEEYKQTQIDVANKQESLNAKKAELEAQSNELAGQKQELSNLVDQAGSALADKKAEVNAAQSNVDAIEKQMKEEERRLAAAHAAEQLAKQQQIMEEIRQQEESGQGKEDTSQAMSGYSESDLRLLACIIEAEAEGESYAGKLAVASVVMNRVFSSKFPNSISGVVYQKNQFEPASSGRLQKILDGSHDGRRSMNDSYSAAREALNGTRTVDKLFFWATWLANQRGLSGGITIGNHYFF